MGLGSANLPYQQVEPHGFRLGKPPLPAPGLKAIFEIQV
jgi:hypothetical protein